MSDVLNSLGEYLRRSARNLGMGGQAMLDNAQAQNRAIKAGADATQKMMAGQEMTQAETDAVHNSPIGGFGTDGGGPAPGGAIIGTYVGRGAKNVPQGYLRNAEKAAERGMDNEAIRQKYGWFQDPAGDWKYEVSDHKARIFQDKDGNWKLHHPELRRQYPDLVDNLQIQSFPAKTSLGQDNPMQGYYLRDSNKAHLNERLLNSADPSEALRTLLHELQHGVQFREGFSPGTNPASDAVNFKVENEQMPRWHALHEREAEMREQRRNWMNAFKDGSLEDFYKQHPEWTAEYDQLLKDIREHPSHNEMQHRTYESALGEVEARDTMERAGLSPGSRKNVPPYEWGRGPSDISQPPIPWDQIWDVREVEQRMRPKKAADVPDEELRRLIQRRLGLLPE